jgi:molybdate/tungstate transport system permease protein
VTWRRSPLAAFPLFGALLVFLLLAPIVYVLTAVDPSQVVSVLADPDTRAALGVSLVSATIATILLALLGVPLGYLLARQGFPGKTWLTILVFLPLICPPSASGILLLLFFGPNRGLGGALHSAGIQLVDNVSGIVLAQMFVSAPFVIVTARAAFEAVPVIHERVSLTLGEGPWMTFWRVALPLARDGILAGILFAWLRSMGEFGATLVMAYHPYTLPVLMWVELSGTGLASALPVVLLSLLVSVLVLAVLFRFDRRLTLLR